jgi:predicted RNA-binding protein with PUA-like domain
MNYWLLKTEPSTFSWADLVQKKGAAWDGVRNFQARKNLQGMKKGDIALIYHTGDEKAIVGIATVAREGYPEPGDPAWTAVDLLPEKPLKNPVTLAIIRAQKNMQKMVLVRAPRLSVQPVTKAEFDLIIKLSGKP